ncbi:hypothetical protein HDU83_005498 [Entophlyctis luteolus]|nr:hypothetical protein HDU83_005498 [Entophlyctis luteolus]
MLPSSLADIVVGPIRDLQLFLHQAVRHFGFGFMLIIGLTYFLQGFRGYAFGDGIIWFFSSVFGLDPGKFAIPKVTISQANRLHNKGPTQLFMSTILVTWNIKMVYGLLFDNFPLFGLKDIPYMMLSGVVAFVGFAALGVPSLTYNPSVTTFWFFLALMGLAMSDVIVDAMVVRHAKAAGESGGVDLQAYCWVLSSIGSIIGRPLAGSINGKDGQGSRFLLGVVYSSCSLLGCIVSLLHKEEKCSNPSWGIKKFVHQLVRLLESVFGNKLVYLPVAWIILNQAIVPDVSAAMNFWKKDIIDIGADKKAYIDTIGDLFSMGGIIVYTRYFKKVKFSIVFFWTQIAISLFALSDIILTIINTLYSLQSMPFFVLAAQLCPKDIEATFYAAMMSMGNVGGNIGTLFGGYLLETLHIVRISANSTAATNSTTSAAVLGNASSLLTALPSTSVASTTISAAISLATSVANSTTAQNSSTAAAVAAAPSSTGDMYDFTNLVLALWIRVGTMALSAFVVFVMVPNVPDQSADGTLQKDGTENGEEHIKLVRQRSAYSQVGDEEDEEHTLALNGL